MRLFPIDRSYVGSLEQRCALWQISTVLISRFVNAIRLFEAIGELDSVVKLEPHAQDEIFMLKELTWHYVILNHELATVQFGQKQAVRTVYQTMMEASRNERNWKLFPWEFQEELQAAGSDQQLVRRVVTDYVASMAESEITRIYNSLRGVTERE